jgi:hypothetical protein
MKTLTMIAAVAMVATAPLAHAQNLLDAPSYWDGAKLYEKCSKEEGSNDLEKTIGELTCTSYLAGVVDNMNAVRAIALHTPECNVILGQVENIVMAYLDAHPERRSVSAAVSVVSALDPVCGPKP